MIHRLGFKFYDGKDGDDGERAVLPAITFCDRRAYGLKAYVICIGWWKWHIGLRLILTDKESSNGND